jgi:hypothetical protein
MNSSWPQDGELLIHEGMSRHKRIATKIWTKENELRTFLLKLTNVNESWTWY